MSDPNVDPVKGLLSFLAAHLVDEPQSVAVSESAGDSAVTYEIRVAPGELGKVIGKQGRIANALRMVAKGAAVHEQRKVFVDIVD